MNPLPPWLHSLPPLVLADLRRRYAGSALGALWAVLSPLIEALAYAIVFGYFLGAASRPGMPYAVLLASGLFPWIALREAIEGSASVLADNRWVRRSRVPMELLVARLVLASLPRALLGLLVALGYGLFRHSADSISAWAPLLALCLQALLVYGLSLAIAPLATLAPDLKPTLVSLLMLATFASPILYPEGMAEGALKTTLEFNPFTHLLRLYRSPAETISLRQALLSAGTVGGWALLALASGEVLQERLWFRARDLL